ncbi:MAG: hypothetical protein D6768_07080 [Chloroflexi bacterium]|nr:MAG: hypothetical protein D6768_07080 [Chloroflexota bacterium]
MKIVKETRSKKENGGLLGAATGLLVGVVAGGSLLVLFGSGIAIAAAVLATFTVIFAAYGTFMGTLLDVDERERGIRPTKTIRSKPRQRTRAKTQPLALPNIQ